jgi:hypothetical protein
MEGTKENGDFQKNLFGFEIGAIKRYCDSLDNNADIRYLEWVLREAGAAKTGGMSSSSGGDLIGVVEAELEYRKNIHTLVDTGPIGKVFNCTDAINSAMKDDSSDKQLACLTERYLTAEKQAENFSYNAWVKLCSLDFEEAYDLATDLKTGEDVPVPRDEEKYQIAKRYVVSLFNRFSEEIIPHIEKKRNRLKAPASDNAKDGATGLKPAEENPPIRWLGTEQQLACLIDLLSLPENKLIEPGTKWKNAVSHFVNKQGGRFTEESLQAKAAGLMSSHAKKTPPAIQKVHDAVKRAKKRSAGKA